MKQKTLLSLFFVLSLFLFLATPVEATTDDAIAYYTFDDEDISGSTITDITGNGYSATISGATTGVTGIINEQLGYDGVNDYVTYGTSINSQINDDFTISFWVNPDNIGGELHEVVIGNGDNTNGWYFTIANTGANNRVRCGNTNNDWSQFLTQDANNHVIFTYDESATTFTYYVNNVQKAQLTSCTIPDANDAFKTGIYPASDVLQADMNLDELAIYDRVLTIVERGELYNSGNGFNPYTQSELKKSLRTYYSFDDADLSGSNPTDLHNSYTVTNNGATTGATGKLGEAFDYDGTNDYLSLNNNIITENTDFTISVWSNRDSADLEGLWQINDETDTADSFIQGIFSGANIVSRYEDNDGDAISNMVSDSTQDVWEHYVFVFNSSNYNVSIYKDGELASVTSTVTRTPADLTGTFDSFGIGYYMNGGSSELGFFDGTIDEFGVWSEQLNATEIECLYNDGTGLTYTELEDDCTGGSGSSAGENLEQTSYIEQEIPVSINSVSYAPVYSSSVTISDDSNVYATVTVPITASSNNVATCRVTKDGVEFGDSERIRSLTAGSTGNLIITTFNETVTAGTYDFGLECHKTGGTTFVVDNSSLYLHLMTGTSGVELPYSVFNVSSAVAYGVVASDTITTSGNWTDTGLTRNLILEWSANTFHDGTVMTVIPEVAGTNCSSIRRSGGLGSTGSIYGICYVDVGNETNSTSYDVKIHALSNIIGTGALEPLTTQELRDAVFHVKEIIAHPSNINSTSLYSVGSTSSLNKTVTLNTTDHVSPTIFTASGISVENRGVSSFTGTYYLTNNTLNSSFTSRSYSPSSFGVIGIQKQFEAGGALPTFSLIGTLTGTGYFHGGDFVAYVTDSISSTPNEFEVTAQTVYGDSLSDFTITLSDGRVFSTSTGTITVPSPDDTLYNITINEDSGATIPYFSNTTSDWNSTFDLLLNTTAYTGLYANFNGSAVNNFSISYNGTNTSTTSGVVYARLFNDTYNVTIFDADSPTGLELHGQSVNLSASPYLENYTFTLLVPNVFNFTLRDEITEALITNNMSIELITGATAGTYYTSNGTLLLELLTPSDYTIRYKSVGVTNYTERDYIQTLVNRERYNIELFGLKDVDSADMVVTIKDTGGDLVENAEVSLLRYYTSCNCYKIVEMSSTSSSGEAYFVADAYDGHYKFSVNYEGTNYFLSSSPENFVPSSTGLISRTITINLGSAYFQSYRELSDVGRSLTYNNLTKGLSFAWSDPSGIVSRGCLYASYLDGVHYTDLTPVCQEASTGSVVMVLNDSTNTFKYYAEIETSTTYSEYTLFTGFIEKVSTNWTGSIQVGAFLGAVFIIILALMFSFSAIAVMVVTALGVVGMVALGLATFSLGFVIAFVTLVLGLGAYFMRS